MYYDNNNKEVINKSFVYNFLVNNIDKNVLFDLFIDKFQDKLIFINALKKFNFIKEENYADTIEYEKALSAIFSSMEFYSPPGIEKFPLIVEFKYKDEKKWKKFLKNYEKNLNLKIQKQLIDLFNEYKN